MSLPDTMERVGVVVGSVLMVALPASMVLGAFYGTAFLDTSLPWWSLLVLLGPGFVVGWAVATERVPVDYDFVWFVCLVGYLLATIVLGGLGSYPPEGEAATTVAVLSVSLVVAAALTRLR